MRGGTGRFERASGQLTTRVDSGRQLLATAAGGVQSSVAGAFEGEVRFAAD
jgi:hypothetical protein